MKKIKTKTTDEQKKQVGIFMSPARVASQCKDEAINPTGGAFLEQTEIARRLGISNNAMRRIAETAKLEWVLILNKRHYDFKKVVEAIKNGK